MPGLAEINHETSKIAGIFDSDAEVYRQVYESAPKPEGVVVLKTNVFKDEYGGHFMEITRLVNGYLKALAEKGVEVDISEGQINSSKVVSGTERFGHLHREQDEVWVVTDGTLTVALYDLRDGSPTFGTKTRLVLSEGMSVRIPPGVVHGFGNYTKEAATLTYFVDMQFSDGPDNQEWRFIPKDPHFWDFAKPDKV